MLQFNISLSILNKVCNYTEAASFPPHLFTVIIYGTAPQISE